jgi:membrane-associated phospholipid phosphatase
MKTQTALLLILFFPACRPCSGRDVADLDSQRTEESRDAPETISPPPGRDISLTKFVPNVASDLKQISLVPVSVARGRHIKPVLAVVGITAGLVAIEEHNKQAFKRTQSFDGFNRVFSGSNTALGTEILPAAFYLVSLARKDVYGQKTFWLAGEAVLDATILTTMMKDIDRRWRPCDVPKNSGGSDTWFEYKRGDYLTGLGSFPSGHTIAAFSLATVFAQRYPKPRWRAALLYGLASLVGFSRVTLQSHFPSDVFAGGALGYAIARNVVLRK